MKVLDQEYSVPVREALAADTDALEHTVAMQLQPHEHKLLVHLKHMDERWVAA